MNEKKWFVYLGDHHEGPFSVDEVRQKMAQGLVTAQSYVWAEGMADWQVMTEVAELKAVLLAPEPPSAPAVPLVAIPVAEPAVAEAVAEPVPVADEPSFTRLATQPEAVVAAVTEPAGPQAEPALAMTSSAPAESPRIVISPVKPAKTEALVLDSAPYEMGHAPASDSSGAAPARRKSGGFLKAVLFLVLVMTGFGAFLAGYLDAFLPSEAASVSARRTLSGIFRPFLSAVEEQVPAVGEWLSPIRRPEDVSDSEYQSLRRAASGNGIEGVNSVGFAVAKADPAQPSFYVSADLPDGALFEVVVRGVPGTLLNTVAFERTLKVTLMERIGRSGVLKAEDGSPAPKGEYSIYVYEATEQSPAVTQALEKVSPSARKLPDGMPTGRKLVTTERVFLGGPKDMVYAERLKEYHERLKAKASTELAETTQFSNTLESQFQSSNSEFARIRKIKIPAQRKKAWTDFNARWSQLTRQLTQTFETWTAEALQNEYLYGPIYVATQQAGAALVAAQEKRGEFLQGASASDVVAGDATAAETEAAVGASLATLKELIAKAEAVLATGGVPQKLAPEQGD